MLNVDVQNLQVVQTLQGIVPGIGTVSWQEQEDILLGLHRHADNLIKGKRAELLQKLQNLGRSGKYSEEVWKLCMNAMEHHQGEWAYIDLIKLALTSIADDSLYRNADLTRQAGGHLLSKIWLLQSQPASLGESYISHRSFTKVCKDRGIQAVTSGIDLIRLLEIHAELHTPDQQAKSADLRKWAKSEIATPKNYIKDIRGTMNTILPGSGSIISGVQPMLQISVIVASNDTIADVAICAVMPMGIIQGLVCMALRQSGNMRGLRGKGSTRYTLVSDMVSEVIYSTSDSPETALNNSLLLGPHQLWYMHG